MHAPYQTAPSWGFIWYNISRPISKQTRKYENSHSVLFFLQIKYDRETLDQNDTTFFRNTKRKDPTY